MSKFRNFVLILATFFITIAFFMPLLVQYTIPPDYSSYNTGEFGCSTFRELIESKGYSVKTIVSSLSVLSRAENDSVLIIMAPVVPYSPTEISGVMEFIKKGGTILVADDNGSANTFLFYLYSFMGIQQGAYFAGGVNLLGGLSIGFLVDVSLSPSHPRTPELDTFYPHPITSGLSKIAVNLANVITYQPPLASPYDYVNGSVIYDALSIESASGGMIIPLVSSSSKSFLDVTNDLYYNKSSPSEPAGFHFVIAAAVSLPNTRMILVSDPTLFTNSMISVDDNRKFAENIIDWLVTENTTTIYIDESHNAFVSDPVQFAFLQVLEYIFSLSTMPFIYSIAPLLAVYSLRRWFKRKKIKIERTSGLEYRVGFTLYTYKKLWYMSSGSYGIALHYIVRKTRKEIEKYTGVRWTSPWEIAMAVAPRIGADPQKLAKKFQEVEKILEKKISKVDERKLVEIYSFLSGIVESLKMARQ